MKDVDAALLDAILHVNDIRGRVPEQLDEELAARLGAAFAVYLKEADPNLEMVIVGRDMRKSSPSLSEAFCEAVLSVGVDVVDLGLASTDMLYVASGRLGAPGVVFTASHNPPEYNGIKACLRDAAPIDASAGLARVRELVLSGVVPAQSRSRGTLRSVDILEEFAQHVRSFVDTGNLAGLRVVADAGNGMAGMVLPAVFKGTGVDMEILYGELDSDFPNHPADPLVKANLADLRSRLREVDADAGLAFDGDADRVFFVDERAEPLSGSVAGALLAASVLEREPGATVLYNAACSRVVAEVIAESGGVGIPTRVGHSLIKSAMASTGAAFAAEHSGHFYFRGNYRSDSGALAAMIFLEAMGASGLRLSELRAAYDRYSHSGEVNFSVPDPAEAVERLASVFADMPQSRLDGLGVDCGSWWFNVRASNTEPLLRLNLEATDEEECSQRTAEIRSLISGMPARASG